MCLCIFPFASIKFCHSVIISPGEEEIELEVNPVYGIDLDSKTTKDPISVQPKTE